PPAYGPPEEPEMAPPLAPAGGSPRWLLIALPIALVLCLTATVGLGFWAYRQGKLPFIRPTPTATSAPPATPTLETVTATPSLAPSPIAQIALAPSTAELKTGESLTMTVTITNTGDRSWSQTEYNLLGEWEPVLERAHQPEPSSEELHAGQSRQVNFTFIARQEGTATLKVLIRMQIGGDRPRWDMSVSEEVRVDVRP
ncbi:MAG: CARDB domain-containing protein, partial [Anaerolineae bacterium]